ncbi:helix-turn-helix transcriptional regulator [Pseudonocardia endophytica]|uniref:Putative DNA-binding transcriptional regulator YafY n=1 Tax=Pseudonocardia endophytica TaxID=401976 RepID=A0A4R1HYK3_PSEEN|nr:YafY family protein [Pseudonocardia endophytica]TCK27498.1 putative DNA-binding transcriptional regulator YafY [Pseudonocardia endophytica]
MRADRLVAILLLIQARGQVTAAEVAAENEVSTSTARRDLEALSASGVPVYPQPGRGGGWTLVGGARTDLSGLTAPEARALFLLAGPAATADPPVRSALRKLVRALPETFRAGAEAAADAVVVDPARWGARGPDAGGPAGALQEAVVARRRITMGYADRRGNATERLVDPWGLVDKDGTWYLVAGTADGRRTFRLDRITSVDPTDVPSERPDGFDLRQAWDQVVDDVERRRSTVTATVRVAARFVPVLRDHFGRHATVLGGGDGDPVRLRVAAHSAVSIAEQLAGWGARVTVEEPDAVRDELARIGAELVASSRKDP